jgi:HWE histidine kinase
MSAEPLSAAWSPAERSWRLRLLVWGACLVAGAVVLAIVTALVVRDRTATLSQAQNEAYTLATVLADHVDRVVENADLVIAQATAIAAPSGAPIATDRATWQQIKDLKERSPYVSAIWIGDAAGNSVLTSYVHPSPQLNAASRDYVRFVRDNPTRMSITYVPRSLYANVPQIKITRRIGAPDEPYRGFITVDVSQEQFKALYRRLRIGSSVVIWLLDPNGQPLSRDPVGTPEQFTSPDWIPAMLDAAPEGIVTADSPVTGEERLYVFRRSPTYGPVSLITTPTRAVLSPWRGRLWVYLALAAAALAAIGVIGAGTLGWLARHQARSDELERRVQERTAELKDALKQKDILVAELNHRVKNTLATVQSIARQTLRTSPDLKAFGHSFDQRLMALSSTYARIGRPPV